MLNASSNGDAMQVLDAASVLGHDLASMLRPFVVPRRCWESDASIRPSSFQEILSELQRMMCCLDWCLDHDLASMQSLRPF
jgi:hypothetical protein